MAMASTWLRKWVGSDGLRGTQSVAFCLGRAEPRSAKALRTRAVMDSAREWRRRQPYEEDTNLGGSGWGQTSDGRWTNPRSSRSRCSERAGSTGMTPFSFLCPRFAAQVVRKGACWGLRSRSIGREPLSTFSCQSRLKRAD